MANNNSLYTIGLAAIGGIVAALVLSKQNVNTIKNMAAGQITSMAMAHPLAPMAVGTAMGKLPITSRAFPDRSFLFNSLPSPSVEHNVPFDITGRFSTITGAYDNKCDYQVFP